MYKSIAAFCLTNIGGDLVEKENEEGSTDRFTFFSDLVNRPELDTPDSAGPGNKPLSPAVGARLSIPVENISNLVTSYFVADSVNTALNESLYKNEDRTELINQILKTTKLDFTKKENLIPEGIRLPNSPKKPGSTKDAKELARKVILTYQNLLTEIESKVKTEVSNRLANISINKVINDVLNRIMIWYICNLKGFCWDNKQIRTTPCWILNEFTNIPEPKDRFKTSKII